ncbi:MAG: glycosyltransferase [bacterium]
MNILFITDVFNEAYGSEKNLYTLAKGLLKRGEKPIVCGLRCGPLKARLEAEGCPVYNLNIQKLYTPHGFRQFIRVLRLVRREKIELVVTYHEASDLLGMVVAKFCRIPIISNRRDMGFKLSNRQIYIYRLIDRYFDKIITVSEAVKAKVIEREKVPSRDILTIYNGLDLTEFDRLSKESISLHPAFNQKLRTKNQEIIVGMVAGIKSIKGHKYFVEAASLVLKEFSKVKFLLVGCDHNEPTCSFEILMRQAEKLGIKDRIIYVGHQQNIPNILLNMDISVLSSLSEGFSNTVIESMAAGLPVITTNVGGNPEAVDDRITGFIVPPADEKKLAEGIIKLLENPQIGRRMGKNGRDKVKRLFSIDEMIEKHQTLYNQLLYIKKAKRTMGYLYASVRNTISKAIELTVSRSLYYAGIIYLIEKNKHYGGIKILAYHKVNDIDIFDLGLAVSTLNFERQMRFLKANYNVISLEQAAEYLRKKMKVPLRSVVITFDDGYEDNYRYAFPILKKYKLPATIFLAADFINTDKKLWVEEVIEATSRCSEEYLDMRDFGLGRYYLDDFFQFKRTLFNIIRGIKRFNKKERERVIDYLQSLSNNQKRRLPIDGNMLNWDMIEIMKKNNISFGAHTNTHSILTKVPLEDARYEISESKKALERRLGEKISFFSYPNGSSEDINKEIIDIVKENEYLCAVTLIRGSNKNVNPYELRRILVIDNCSINISGRFSEALFAARLAGIF